MPLDITIHTHDYFRKPKIFKDTYELVENA